MSRALNLFLSLANRLSLSGVSSLARIVARILFGNGEPGIDIDASDLTTLFQDDAGTTPVTEPGQTVALGLSKDKGLVLGPDLKAGTWNTAAGWVSGDDTVTGTATTNTIVLTPSTSITGKFVEIEVEIVATSGTVRVVVGDVFPTIDFKSVSGTYRAIVRAGSNTVAVDGGDSFTGSVRIVSVRELPGTHLTQPTAAARPTWGRKPKGGRRNLFGFTEDIANAYWVKRAITIITYGSFSPNGALANTIVENSSTTIHDFFNAGGVTLTAGSHTAKTQIKMAGRRYVRLGADISGGSRGAVFDLQAGSVVSESTGYVGEIETKDDGWYEISITFTATAAAYFGNLVSVNSDNSSSTVGLGGAAYQVGGIQIGATNGAYQRVTTQFDVTEAGVAPVGYLYFNGINRWMSTATITPGTDKVQVFAGVRKLSDASPGVIVESVATEFGSFSLLGPLASADYRFGSRGSLALQSAASPASYAAPISNVLTGLGDISGDLATLRVNGAQVAQNTGDQGTGNYLPYQLFVGARAGTSIFLSAELYQLKGRFGPNLDAADIAKVEQFTASKVAEPTT